MSLSLRTIHSDWRRHRLPGFSDRLAVKQVVPNDLKRRTTIFFVESEVVCKAPHHPGQFKAEQRRVLLMVPGVQDWPEKFEELGGLQREHSWFIVNKFRLSDLRKQVEQAISFPLPVRNALHAC